MQLAIRHETLYRYTQAQVYSIEQLHLTPRAEPQQQVQSWKIAMPGHASPYVDAYGNFSHTMTLNEPHETVRILVEGVVGTAPLQQGRLAGVERLSPLVFTVPTRLTQPTPALADLAAHCLPAARTGTAEAMALAAHIFGAVEYRSGATGVAGTAGESMALGAGVCQDHAHIFLACCHVRGVPARYVSGYIDSGTTGHGASHAWVDVWVEDPGHSGWVSIDVTHKRLMDEAYCRLAIGRDYESAAPVRGMRRGGGDETMSLEALVESVPTTAC